MTQAGVVAAQKTQSLWSCKHFLLICFSFTPVFAAHVCAPLEILWKLKVDSKKTHLIICSTWSLLTSVGDWRELQRCTRHTFSHLTLLLTRYHLTLSQSWCENIIIVSFLKHLSGIMSKMCKTLMVMRWGCAARLLASPSRCRYNIVVTASHISLCCGTVYFRLFSPWLCVKVVQAPHRNNTPVIWVIPTSPSVLKMTSKELGCIFGCFVSFFCCQTHTVQS